MINFLTKLYENGLAYSTVNTYRSALSSTLAPIAGYKVGEHPLVIRLLKGVFNQRPPIKTLTPAWSVQKVLALLKNWSPIEKVDMRCLSYKTLMLIALSSAKRVSSLAMLSIEDGYSNISENRISFQPCGLEKESRVDHIAPPIVIESFHDSELDPVICVKEYIKRTKDIRQTSAFFVTIQKPHKAAVKATLSSWIVKVIKQSGQSGSSGSIRSVSSSKAVYSGATLETVMAAGDWVRESTFARHYYRPNTLSFAEAVLK